MKPPTVHTTSELTLRSVTEQRRVGDWTFVVYKYEKMTSTGPTKETVVTKGAEGIFGNDPFDGFLSGALFPRKKQNKPNLVPSSILSHLARYTKQGWAYWPTAFIKAAGEWGAGLISCPHEIPVSSPHLTHSCVSVSSKTIIALKSKKASLKPKPKRIVQFLQQLYSGAIWSNKHFAWLILSKKGVSCETSLCRQATTLRVRTCVGIPSWSRRR
ncbi:hypothetical protein CNMCM7691_006624 [Aspergillus felis]|uniref:Uncharacterized protein n=1 Tax=Aspergillus felis TaxID=1287682 RepID=A0A8H6QRS1_9EURO|nr:hypothetical protein CNMCM7691_006624 [Aspergillus felis]